MSLAEIFAELRQEGEIGEGSCRGGYSAQGGLVPSAPGNGAVVGSAARLAGPHQLKFLAKVDDSEIKPASSVVESKTIPAPESEAAEDALSLAFTMHRSLHGELMQSFGRAPGIGEIRLNVTGSMTIGDLADKAKVALGQFLTSERSGGYKPGSLGHAMEVTGASQIEIWGVCSLQKPQQVLPATAIVSEVFSNPPHVAQLMGSCDGKGAMARIIAAAPSVARIGPSGPLNKAQAEAQADVRLQEGTVPQAGPGEVFFQPAVMEAEKCPVTILTGFLGSGKTTMLNHILREQREKRFVVIENEFGEESIDTALVNEEIGRTNEEVEMFTLANGCVCCTVRGDLVQALKKVAQKLQEGSMLDGVLIETTGLADPAPIVRTFRAQGGLDKKTRDAFRLDAVLTVVDAKHIRKRIADDQAMIEKEHKVKEEKKEVAEAQLKADAGKEMNGEEAGRYWSPPVPDAPEDFAPAVSETLQQVLLADSLVMNKVDLVSAEELVQIRGFLRGLNPSARLVPAVRGVIDLRVLGSIRAYDLSHMEENAEEEESGSIPRRGHRKFLNLNERCECADCTEVIEPDSTGISCTECDPPPHHHELEPHGGISGEGLAKQARSFVLRAPGKEAAPAGVKQFLQNVASAAENRAHGILFRTKGILAVQGREHKTVFQMVYDTYDLEEAGPWAEGEEKVSRAVFIGVDLNRAFFEDQFRHMFDEGVPIEDEQEKNLKERRRNKGWSQLNELE